MLAAVALFGAMDALLKGLAGHYPPMQVSAMRGAAALPFVVGSVALAGRLADLKPVRWEMQALRAFFTLLSLFGFVYSVSLTSLANAYSVFLAAPLIVTALSVLVLHERVDAQRWTAVAVGLAGVVVMLRPTGEGLVSIGAAFALLGGVGYALNAITLRVLTRTETNASVVFWTTIGFTVVAGAIAAPAWVPVQREHLPWIAGVGLFGAAAQYLLTVAFRRAPASVIAPFEYTALLWGMFFDLVVWNVLPGARVLAGGGLVVASGLYLVWRERRGATAAGG
jgi:drug/metabolite transporter (DMT)-like permease